jgi:hypothetical protein
VRELAPAFAVQRIAAGGPFDCGSCSGKAAALRGSGLTGRRTPYKVLLEVQNLSFAERFPMENVGAPAKTHSKPN